MLFSYANKILEPGYLPLETGYYRLIDGQFLVAVLTRMRGCSAKMVDWWFGYLDNSEKYRMWCPNDHLELNAERHSQSGQYIGTSHLVKQKIGGIIKTSQIIFHHPSHFLNDFEIQKNSNEAVICANGYNLEKVLECRIMHYIRNTDFGCDVRSRIWLMDGSDDLANDMMRHCLEEMGNLAGILPGLFSGER